MTNNLTDTLINMGTITEALIKAPLVIFLLTMLFLLWTARKAI